MQKKMKIKYIIVIAAVMVLGLPACMDLDIPPKNIMLEDDIYNKGGITAYMAGMYNHLPMEDYNISKMGDYGGYFYYHSRWWPTVSTGETVNHNQTSLYLHQMGYWSQAYEVIRNANRLIEGLASHPMEDADHYIGEARFIRAYTYYALVKRYGGVPVIDKAQTYEGDASALWVPRSSHKESYDFILSDLDFAIDHMKEKSDRGRANKYVAAAFKSRVALAAGTTARYGESSMHVVEDVMLCGIPVSDADRYFEEAWRAARIVEAGSYRLMADDADLEKNFEKIFAQATSSPESIFIREYSFNNYRHSFDAIYSPPRMATEWGSSYGVTLDWVELFDGIPLDSHTGHLQVTDEEGNYIVFNSNSEFLENAEPRLKASLMIPGRTYKEVQLDIRRGVIAESVDPSVKIKKFVPDDGNSTAAYSSSEFFNEFVKTNTQNPLTQTPYVTSTGVKLNLNGLDGPDNGGARNTLTGFHGRKWLDMTLTKSTTKYGESYSPWIDIRYAEVLLNRAEAALELFQNGTVSLDEVNLQNDAFDRINSIRARAGAELLLSATELSDAPAIARHEGKGGFVWAPNRGIQIVRVERYKELAFEHKIFWDLKRWFSFDKQIYNYRRRMINPFLFARDVTLNAEGNPVGKYIIDTRVCERANNNLTFTPKSYYDPIPGSQLKSNPLLKQNKDY